MKFFLKKSIPLILFAANCNQVSAQIAPAQDAVGRDNESNIISTAASFLLISPDSRSAGLGDAGVATSPDINSQHWNAAKYIFAEHKSGISFSYTPWLRNYVDDMNITHLAGYSKIKDHQALGYSLTYFSYGDMTFTDYNGSTLKNFKPKEFAVDGSYSLKLADNLSSSITMRYIYSNLTGGLLIGNSEESHAGHSIAGDIAVYYQKEILLGEKSSTLSLGANISNIGSKMSYTSNNQNFIPTNLKLGTCYKFDFDDYNSLSFTIDLNKLLVPTPPIYNTNGEIIKGKKDDVSVPRGIFQSFSDAPDGFSEEIKEVSYSFGFEYWYSKTFAGRMGYFTESNEKGGRRYMTFGLGLNIKSFTFDFAYLITTTQSNPLQNTIRFSLGFYLDNSKK
ncbi:MAG: type IX secretion system outer membrane channel protein PorV [Bacteroidales bacterium]|jgi:hypothetical protein|nr:type IX secretion system outer membrane channel protein PorV [Bacteroidales bacterium]MBR6279459.1 type IX secretion system outer membrane channel protein PorV [Bacteroidales bacterium]